MPLSDIITPDFVRNAVLPTVRFIGRDGVPISNDYFYQEIDNAISEVEAGTGLALRIDHRKLVEERKDNLSWHDETWFLKKSLKRPIKTIERFGFVYGNFPVDYLPSDWILPSSFKMGQVQIVPGPTGVYMNTYNLWFPTAWDGGAHYMAGLIKLDYYAGYEHALEGTHTTVAGQSVVTITDVENQAFDFEPGNWIRLGTCVRRIASVVDGNSYRVTHPVATAYEGPAILMTYPPLVIKAVSALAGVGMLALAETLLFSTPGMTGKHLSMDGMSQGKSFNRLGPYATWRAELKESAERAMRAIHAEHTPIRITVI